MGNSMMSLDEDSAHQLFKADRQMSEPGANTRPSQRFGLSKISQKYDIDGDGRLDEAEQALRDMDQSGRGFLSNDKAHDMMVKQMKLQRQLFSMKRMVIMLGIFTVILTLSNLATAWAAAILVKDSSVDAITSDMLTKDGSHMVGTQAKGAAYGATPVVANSAEERRLRKLALWDSNSTNSGSSWTTDDAIATDCDTNVLVRIKYACPDFTVRYQDIDCNSYVHYATTSAGTSKYRDSTNNIDLACARDTCAITGLDCRALVGGGGLAFGEGCYEDKECESGLCLGSAPPDIAGMCDKSVKEGSSACPYECTDGQRCDEGVCVDLLTTCPATQSEAEAAEVSSSPCLIKSPCSYEPNCCEDGATKLGYQYECFCDEISGQFGPCWSRGLGLGCHNVPSAYAIDESTDCTAFCGDENCSPWENSNDCPSDC